MTNPIWDVKTYSQFLDLRTRPAKDLLSAIPDSFTPKLIYDLGCGPGNSTILLKNRWPNANVVGLDSSPSMLKEAKFLYSDIHFVEGDIAKFSSSEKIDLIFANASLQWLDHHELLIPRLLDFLNPGGALGIQMPNNFHSPSHQTTVKLLHGHADWSPILKKLRYGFLTTPFYKLSWYYDLLCAQMIHLSLWETEYVQELGDYSEIYDWVKGTGLRPVLNLLDLKNQEAFRLAYIKAISEEYPRQINKKILFPFKRIFILGFKN